MRKIILFILSLVISMGVYSQTRQPDVFLAKQLTYFEDMTLDEYVESGWDNSFSNIIEEKRYTATAALLDQVELVYLERSGQISEKLTKNPEMQLITRVVYLYNNKGLLETEAIRDRKNRQVSTSVYAYDDRGFQIERTLRGQNDRFLARTFYTNDSRGRMIKSETKDPSGNPISHTEYTYDSQGNLTEQRVFNSEGVLTSIIRSEWQNGRETKNVMLDANGRQQLVVTKTYGQNGELLEEVVQNIQGDSKQVLKYEYTVRTAGRRS